ncbi:MAG TPA: hypothetical protein ENJ01_00185 [Gammaproteobacteria bacterium]|nr:hypothetical protein [Gammaproteobacteria bacterium]
MKKMVFGVLLVLLSMDAQALRPSVEIIERFDDFRIVAFIDEADLADYPVWDPMQGEVPLSIGGAIQAVRAKHNHMHLQNSIVREIELREIAGRRNYWHYLIVTRDASRDDAQDEVYVVLMNGKVIPAIIEPESVK